MTVARTVADVLAEHTGFEVECIDRMYLNVYQPRLQYATGLVGFVHRHLGLPMASTAVINLIKLGGAPLSLNWVAPCSVPRSV